MIRVVSTVAFVVLVSGGMFSVETRGDETPQKWVKSHLPEVLKLYKHLHTHPELSFQEKETSARMAAELRAVGAEVTEKIGGFGVVGLLRNGKGPRLMLRTDMDALPVVEQTNLIYASTVKVRNESGATIGVMHACGHDIHMSNMVGVARYLAANKKQWRGTVMFLCQPAEERGAGAKAMLEDGLWKRFGKPDFAIALHVDPTLAAGEIGYRAGFALANVDSVDITVHGRGGHGAYPHTTIDPIVQAAHLIVDLQSIVSREISPLDSAVITVGSIHGGTKHNIIGKSCHLQLTVRSYSEKVRKHLLDAIRRKAMAAAKSAGAPDPTVKVSEGTPAMFNNEKLVARVVPAFKKRLGENHVVSADPQMGGEDFSRYGKSGVPIFMYRLGSVDSRRLASYTKRGLPSPSLHSPLYFPDPELTLATGIRTMAGSVLELLGP